ncbi:hypothetical protein PLEOSDRAFT_1102883 [Pleurotus ostreatus PC15]|uniref:Uncharacterized protein n=1 Tax=Pleurotus ostreatus (strain PC15) TaxID=1137138 RepID=A0A067NLS0_PLEO1|nr:hypothetical protein PLEOSDRAFT_1102883 [Pleurotus ostreatus PC15]
MSTSPQGSNAAQQHLEQIIRGLRDHQSLGKRKRSSHTVQTEITIDREAVEAAKRYLNKIGKAISRLANPFRTLNGSGGARLPGFQSLIDEFQKNEYGTQWESLLQELSHMSGICRSNDTSSLKKCPRLLLSDVDPTPPELQSIDKSSRGFNSPVCAKFLCPIKYANDPGAIQRIKDGSIKVRASSWPSFVYEEESYDPDNMDRHASYLHKSYHCNKASSEANVCGCNTRKLGITQVTPNMIAYAAVQTCVMLSAASSWTNEDGDFVLSIFYDRIINLFHDDEGGEWTQQTLAWWNRQVFPGVEAVSDENDKEEEEEDLRLKHQRLERANRTQPGIRADGGPQTEGEA